MAKANNGIRGQCALSLVVAGVLAGLSTPVAAQLAPDAGSIMRETEQLRAPQEPRLSPRTIAPAPVKPDPTAVQFVIKEFRLTGVTLVPIAELQALLKPWLNREITFEDLDRALAAIANFYQERGWFVRPQLPAQDIVDGVVTINVIEAKLGRVEPQITEDMPLSAERIERFLTARQKPGEPLNMDELSHALTVLNEQPGVSAQVALAPSGEAGASDVIVETMRLPSVSGNVQVDNWGAKSTGYWRGTGNVNWNNPFGYGDQFQANFMASEGTVYGRLGYNMPIGYDGWRLGVSYSALAYKLLGEFATLNNKGNAQTLLANLSYPLIRQPAANATFTLTGSDSSYENKYSLESDEISIRKRVSSVSLGVTGDRVDDFWGGGFNVAGLTATGGYTNLSGTLANQIADRIGANTQGSFYTLAGNGGRLQRLTDNTSLWLSFSGQMASQNLDSSQKFSLGGPQGVRAYPVYEATGDQGWLGTVEARYNITPEAQASLFYDMGWIQQFKSTSHLTELLGPNTYYLKGWGAAISYNYNNWISAKFTVARRIGGNPGANPITGADGDGTNDTMRYWFNLVIYM